MLCARCWHYRQKYCLCDFLGRDIKVDEMELPNDCCWFDERKNHKLDEWHVFCDWIESLPYFKEIYLSGDNKWLKIWPNIRRRATKSQLKERWRFRPTKRTVKSDG